MIAAERPAYRRWWIVLTTPDLPPAPVSGPRPLPETNESVRALRALQIQIDELKETT